MRHKVIIAVLASSMLATTPAGAAQESEIYRKSIECGALHGVYSGILEDDEPAAAAGNADMSTRYFVMAINRSDGDTDAVDAAAMEETDRLVAFMEDPEVTEADIDAFFGERNAYCDAFNAQVQEEFDAIDMTE